MIDGTRTRDNRNHNPGLYQLSYDRHKEAAKLIYYEYLVKGQILARDLRFFKGF